MAPTRNTMASIYGKAASAVSKKRGSSSPESAPASKPYKAAKASPRRALAVVPQPQQQQAPAAYPQHQPQPQSQAYAHSHAHASSSTSHIPQPHAALAQPRPQAAAPVPPLNPAMAKYAAMRDDDRPKYFEEEYSEDIVRYFYEVDNANLGSADYMDLQPELQWFMRPYLVDFLIEVHHQFRLRPEVLYLAMNIVDRYTSKRVVYKKHFQLVGCSALWIAAKFEDSKDKIPTVRELSDMCCKAYDEGAFLQMEGHVLSTIGWMLSVPTAEMWLRYAAITPTWREDAKVIDVARFLMESTLFHREFVGKQAHLVAAGAHMLARYICGAGKRYGQRHEQAVARIAQAIDAKFGEHLETVSEILIKKYKEAHYHRASVVVREFYLSGRRYLYQPDPPTPMSASLSSSSLGESSAWSLKRGSWMSNSPSFGSMSCASSEYGDEVPITPLTPMSSVSMVPDPFTVARDESVVSLPGSISHSVAKENLPPHTSAAMAAAAAAKMQQQAMSHLPPPKRQALAQVNLPPTVDLTLPPRSMRRLSN